MSLRACFLYALCCQQGQHCDFYLHICDSLLCWPYCAIPRDAPTAHTLTSWSRFVCTVSCVEGLLSFLPASHQPQRAQVCYLTICLATFSVCHMRHPTPPIPSHIMPELQLCAGLGCIRRAVVLHSITNFEVYIGDRRRSFDFPPLHLPNLALCATS